METVRENEAFRFELFDFFFYSFQCQGGEGLRTTSEKEMGRSISFTLNGTKEEERGRSDEEPQVDHPAAHVRRRF